MEFQVGQRVIAVSNGVDYGRTYTNMDYNHNYEVGWEGTVVELPHQGSLSIRFDNGRVIHGCMNSKFKEAEETVKFRVGDKVKVAKLNKEASGGKCIHIGDTTKIARVDSDSEKFPYKLKDIEDYWFSADELELIEPKEEQSVSKFAVGSKVIVGDGSYSMELVDGKPVNTYGYRDELKGGKVFEVTAVNLVLPSKSHFRNKDLKPNDTIIRRISDGRVFFVQQRFLKEYVPEPKFKRGDWVIYGAGYYRVSFSKVKDGKVTYRITQYPYDFNGNGGGKVSEDELREAK